MTAPTIDSTHAASWALVRRAQAGEIAAFGELYDQHNAEVYRYIWLRCGNVQLAQDLAGDVWERALRGINTIKPTASPPLAWLLTIARNRLTDHFRSGRYRLEVVSSDAAEADRADVTEDLQQTVVDRAQSAVMLAAIRMLTPSQQEAIALYYFLGLTTPQGAQVMGIPVVTFRQHLSRGRHQLADILNQLQPEED